MQHELRESGSRHRLAQAAGLILLLLCPFAASGTDADDPNTPPAQIQPVATSDLPLRAYAGLVNHAYTDPFDVLVGDVTLQRTQALLNYYIDQGKLNAAAHGGAQEKYPLSVAIMRKALENEEAEQAFRRARLEEKTRFLNAWGFSMIELPAMRSYIEQLPETEHAQIKVELYRRRNDRNLYLVFGFRETFADWLIPYFTGNGDIQRRPELYGLADRAVKLVANTYRGVPIIVAGHGTGAAIAQYAGLLYNLQTVAFNSEGVQMNRLSASMLARAGNIRSYSAVYPNLTDSGFVPDPVSISNGWSARGLMAHLPHLHSARIISPRCLFLRPDPFINEVEEAAITHDILMIAPRMSIPEFGQVAGVVEGTVKFGIMAAPIWNQSESRVGAALVKKHAQSMHLKAGFEMSEEFKTLVGTARTASDFFNLDFGKLLKTAAFGASKAMISTLIREDVFAHDMERFVRGLDNASGIDFRLQDKGPTTPIWAGQCEGEPDVGSDGESPVEMTTAGGNSPAKGHAATSGTQAPARGAAGIADGGAGDKPSGNANNNATGGSGSGGNPASPGLPAGSGNSNGGKSANNAANTSPSAASPTDTTTAVRNGCSIQQVLGRWKGSYQNGDKSTPLELLLERNSGNSPIKGTSIEPGTGPKSPGQVHGNWLGETTGGTFHFMRQLETDPWSFAIFVGRCDASGDRISGEWRLRTETQGSFVLDRQP